MEKMDVLEKLKDWRGIAARNEGVPLFRVFPNQVLESIAETMPKSREELLEIKGIKEKKFEKYGEDVLAIVGDRFVEDSSASPQNDSREKDEIAASPLAPRNNRDNREKKPYTVSGYLDLLNVCLQKQGARVKGEIGSLNIRSGYLFFSLKDKEDESALSCFMWAGDYKLCGIDFVKKVSGTFFGSSFGSDRHFKIKFFDNIFIPTAISVWIASLN